MIHISLESIYHIVMIPGAAAAFLKWVYHLGYQHGKNAKK